MFAKLGGQTSLAFDPSAPAPPVAKGIGLHWGAQRLQHLTNGRRWWYAVLKMTSGEVQVMWWKARLMIAGVAALAIGAAVQGVPLPNPIIYGSVAVVNAIEFYAGNYPEISGWFWLQPSTQQFATWLFPPLDVEQISDEDPYLYINLSPLVTNGINGGSGWGTRVWVIVYLVPNPDPLLLRDPSGLRIVTTRAYLRNFFRPVIEGYTHGVGYQAYADPSSELRIPKEDLQEHIEEYGPFLLVVVVREGEEEGYPEFIGVNKGCLRLAYRVASQ